MSRTGFVAFAFLAAAMAASAEAQTDPPPASAQENPRPAPRPIEPANALEQAFVSALTDEAMRPVFRRQLLDSHVALAMTSNAPDAAPMEITLREGVSAALLFTSASRLNDVLGPAAPRVVMTGRAALERLRGKNVILNVRLAPMLTLEPEDVARYLAAPTPPASAGPSQ